MENPEIVSQVVQLKEIVKTTEVFDILNKAAVNLHTITQHAHNMLGLYLSSAVSAEEQLRSFNLQEMQMVIDGRTRPMYLTRVVAQVVAQVVVDDDWLE